MIFPKDCIKSVYDVDFKALYEMGYRLLLFDVDNTLVEHNALANDKAKELFKNLKQIGYKVYFLSNNKEDRVKRFSNDVKGDGYLYKCHKPSKKSYIKACKISNISKEKALFFGDQIFTDIMGANRAKILSVLVSPVRKWHEEIQIIIKRFIEMPFILLYKILKYRKKGIIPIKEA